MSEEVSVTGWQESYRGMVFTTHCDHLHHLNNRWYAHFFDDGMMAFWSRSGLVETAFEEKFGAAAVLVKTAIEYHHELVAGDQFVIEAAFTRIGNKSITNRGRLLNAVNGAHCASYEGVTVFMNRRTGKSVEVPADVRATIESMLVPAS